ncbi:MAG: hypothetical protein OEM79_00515 [Nitrosopumilus sp.]|nr:hypothetical protein [Nitrosopumilus sp.]
MDYHVMDYHTVIKRMETFMSKFDGDYSDWYIGITKDLNEGLFQVHNVEETGIWISFGADTDEVAKKVEKYFLDKKTDGNPKELEENTRIVYIYKKKFNTTP